MPTKKELKKDNLTGMIAELQRQAGDGEIDASLIDRIAAAANGTVNQAGDPVNEGPEDANRAAQSLGTEAVEPAPADATPPPTGEDEEKDDEVKKVDPVPMATRPPEIIVPGGVVDANEHKLPAFMKALEGGSLREAQDVIDVRRQGSGFFDEMLQKSFRACLSKNGFNKDLITGGARLSKAMTSATLPGVNLMPLARLMIPVYAGLTRRIGLNNPVSGSNKATWKALLGLTGVDYSAAMSKTESAIGAENNETFTEFNASYRESAVSDKVNLAAIASSKGFDDPLQVSVIISMTTLLGIQERKLLGDVFAAIGNPAAVTGVGSGTGTLGNATDKFIVTALTYQGYIKPSTGGASAVGETDGTISAAIDLHLSADVELTWDAVPGAVAYNIYYNPSSHATNKWYWQTVTVNYFKGHLPALPSSGNNPPATNVSANATGYEGLLSWCERSSIYGNSITGKLTPTDQGGAKLTKGTGGIDEIDAVLADIWNTWQMAPTLMVMSSDTAKAIRDLLMGLSQYRIEVSGERGNIAGGMFVGSYTNLYAPYADGTPRVVDLMPHPYMPDGTILFLSESVPYQMSRETRGFAREQLFPYTYFPLGATTAVYPYSLLVNEVPECFHPSVQTAIQGVGL